MSEHKPAQYEQHEQFEGVSAKPERLALPDAEHAEPLRPGEADPLNVEQARSIAEQSASDKNPLEQLQAAEKAADEPTQASQVPGRELLAASGRRQMQDIRRRLPSADRALSRVIHQPVIRAVSEVGGKTISRPSGLLGGGLTALIGTTGYLFFARHFGFQYNYVVFVALFVGGFAIGLALELFVWAATSSHRHATE